MSGTTTSISKVTENDRNVDRRMFHRVSVSLYVKETMNIHKMEFEEKKKKQIGIKKTKKREIEEKGGIISILQHLAIIFAFPPSLSLSTSLFLDPSPARSFSFPFYLSQSPPSLSSYLFSPHLSPSLSLCLSLCLCLCLFLSLPLFFLSLFITYPHQ